MTAIIATVTAIASSRAASVVAATTGHATQAVASGARAVEIASIEAVIAAREGSAAAPRS